ncbi:MAG TPA: DUF5666 domain-containing protein [Anaerolineales bacterium]|jgi:hypothetical protein|nr:DUF5666 domain-containing protein [Anaerolineales bacterium]
MKECYEAFESCLVAMENGDSLEACLERYPDLEAELRPLLESAQAAKSISDDHVPDAAFQRSRARVLGKASQLRAQHKPKRIIFGRVPRWAMAMVAFALALVFFMSWRGVTETARALPGDPFYPVKRSAENFRIQIASNPEARRAMEVKYERQRVDEVMELLSIGRITQVTFEGLLDERTPDRWIIEGIPVSVTPDTQLIGEIETTRVVEVTGKTQASGEVIASRIALHSYQLVGKVDSIGSDMWVISGISLEVQRDSQIDPAARIDDQVIALVEVQTDGSLQALAILRLLQPELVATGVPQKTEAPSSATTQEPKLIEITGVVESISGDTWTIDGQQVTISAATEIKDRVSVGDHVRVHALLGVDGSLMAREIEFDSSFQQNLNENDDQLEEFKAEDDEGERQGIEDNSGGEDGTEAESSGDSGDDHDKNDDHSTDNSGGDDDTGDNGDNGDDHSGGGDGDHSGDENEDRERSDDGEEQDSYLGYQTQLAGKQPGEFNTLLFIL